MIGDKDGTLGLSITGSEQPIQMLLAINVHAPPDERSARVVERPSDDIVDVEALSSSA